MAPFKGPRCASCVASGETRKPSGVLRRGLRKASGTIDTNLDYAFVKNALAVAKVGGAYLRPLGHYGLLCVQYLYIFSSLTFEVCLVF